MRTPLATLAMTLLVSQGVLADDNTYLNARNDSDRAQAQVAKHRHVDHHAIAPAKAAVPAPAAPDA
ncbi:hypothetical protein D3880_21085 [Pseudomonas cavernae]|uniref:DUF4148 domain-containing protein n=1 Tax=Pseudomonas cavernae TaxID=2320867 RepID=A0A385Z982_9PSED|nr:hypothetical protein [Pseudomonas cavernae]AYC34713.1 hypothetical protein D3880_21085 [Pseudomonas cavernae]